MSPRSKNLEKKHQRRYKVWNDRPLFVWQGQVNKIIVHDDQNTVLWEKDDISLTDSSVRYDGEPLQHGKIYSLTLVLVTPSLGAVSEETSFALLSADEQREVGEELAQLETQVRASGATPEELALWRSRFFIQHDLRLLYDGLDALFSVENPSPELAQQLAQIKTALCGTPTEE